MDFAPAPVLEALTPRPTRPAPPRAPTTESFNDHLDAVNEQTPERPAAAANEAGDEAALAVETMPADDSVDEPVDPDVALLGGPLPPAPAMSAPVVVQIAASQPLQQQAPDASGADAAGAAPLAAPTSPQAPINAEAAPQGEPGLPAAPAEARNAQAEVKPAAPEAQPSQTAPQTTNTRAQVPGAAPQQVAAQATAEAPSSPVVQQAIAAAAPQAIPQDLQRTAKAPSQSEAKVAASPLDGRPEAPVANTRAKAIAQKASNGGNAVIDAAPLAPQPQSSTPDASQAGQSATATATAAQASTHVQQAAVDTGAQRAAPAAAQVGREIIRRFDGGATSFELRLDPPELGRVEIRMEVTRDNRVTAVIAADNPQALTELARHARELEQQLQSAGLQLSDNGLSFDLRQGAQGGETEGASSAGAKSGGEEAMNEQQQQAQRAARPIGYERWRGVRVDMMV